MSHDSLTQTLIGLGLSENESRVYIAALSLGASTVQNIASTAGIKRTTVYSVIDSLKQKGLMLVKINGFKKTYEAESPDRLASILDQRKDLFSKELPKFLSLYNLKGKESVIKYYEGKDAVKTVYESNVRDIPNHGEYMIISNAEKVFELYGDWFHTFVEKRGKKNINIRILLQDTKWNRDYKKTEKNFNQKIKFLPKETELITNTVITPQRVLIHQLQPPIMGIVIENQSAIATHQQLFEVLWNTCN